MPNLTITGALSLNVAKYNDAANMLAESVTIAADADEMNSQYIPLAIGATDVAVNMGTVATATTLLIVSDQLVSVKVNGDADTAISFKTLLLSTAGITAMSLSNPSGLAAKVRVLALGA